MPEHDRGIPRHQRGQVLSEIEDDLPQQYFDLMRFCFNSSGIISCKSKGKRGGTHSLATEQSLTSLFTGYFSMLFFISRMLALNSLAAAAIMHLLSFSTSFSRFSYH